MHAPRLNSIISHSNRLLEIIGRDFHTLGVCGSVAYVPIAVTELTSQRLVNRHDVRDRVVQSVTGFFDNCSATYSRVSSSVRASCIGTEPSVPLPTAHLKTERALETNTESGRRFTESDA